MWIRGIVTSDPGNDTVGYFPMQKEVREIGMQALFAPCLSFVPNSPTRLFIVYQIIYYHTSSLSVEVNRRPGMVKAQVLLGTVMSYASPPLRVPAYHAKRRNYIPATIPSLITD